MPKGLKPQNDVNIGGRFIRGAAWMFAAKLAERGIGLVSTLILARLLWPEDFGLVAMAAPVVALVELFGAWGIDAALIRNRNVTRAHLDTAFTLNLIVCAVIALVLWILAPFAAVFFREARLDSVIKWLSIGSLIQGFGNPGFVMHRKDIQMAPEVMLLLVKKGTSLLVATIAALILGNYWALVWGTLASRAVGVAFSHRMTSYRPRISLSEYREVLGFSLWMLIIQILYFLQLKVNDLIIGRLLGTTQLAYFNVGMDLATSATGEASVSIARVAFPALAKIGDDRLRLASGLRKVLAGVAVFALPAAFGIAAMPDLIVAVVLGIRWMPVADILPAIAISSAAMGIASQVTSVYMSLGKPSLAAFVSIGSTVALVAVSLAFVPARGLAGVNVAYPAMAASAVLGHIIILKSVLPEFRMFDWISALWRPILGSLVMYCIVEAATRAVTPVTSSFAGMLPLLGLVGLGASVFGSVVYVLWRIGGRPDGIEAMVWRKIAVLLRLRPID